MGERLSAAERAHALPEILRRILLFLDDFSLCVALRTGSKLFDSTVPILYRNIPLRVGLAIEPGVISQSGRRGWELTDIQPRERIYLGAIQVLDADHEDPERQQMVDASLMPKGWYTGPCVAPCYFDPRILDSFCVRFPNVRVIRKTTHPFSIAEAFTVDCQLKRVQHRKMIFLYPDDVWPHPKPGDSDLKTWTVEETASVVPTFFRPNQDYRPRLLDFLREEKTASRVSLGSFPADLCSLRDICLTSSTIHTLISYALRPFAFFEWVDFIASASNIQYIRLESHLIQRETVAPVLSRMVDAVKALPSLQIFEFRLRLGEDEESRCTLSLRIARDAQGEMQTMMLDHDDFDELCYPP